MRKRNLKLRTLPLLKRSGVLKLLQPVDEALEMLAAVGDDAMVLAGGQSLVPMLALRLARFGHLIDVNGLAELRGVSSDDDGLRIGAMTRQAALEHDAAVATGAPLLALATPLIGHFHG